MDEEGKDVVLCQQHTYMGVKRGKDFYQWCAQVVLMMALLGLSEHTPFSRPSNIWGVDSPYDLPSDSTLATVHLSLRCLRLKYFSLHQMSRWLDSRERGVSKLTVTRSSGSISTNQNSRHCYCLWFGCLNQCSQSSLHCYSFYPT